MLNSFGGRGHSALPPNRKSMADVLNTIGVLAIVLSILLPILQLESLAGV